MAVYATDEPVTIKCEICGGDTTYSGTRRCNRCWELETRIRASPMIAKKILEDIERPVYKQAWVILDTVVRGYIGHHSETVLNLADAHRFHYKVDAEERAKSIAKHLKLNDRDLVVISFMEASR